MRERWRSRARSRFDLRELEPDAALGNGGLGRLAACFMESMATLGVAAPGYGIRYDHGLFKQRIVDGGQSEFAGGLAVFRNPWEFQRPEIFYEIGFGGAVERAGWDGAGAHTWQPAETCSRSPTTPRSSAGAADHVNTLRLWTAKADRSAGARRVQPGDHVGAIYERGPRRNHLPLLYPSDETPAGQELRLRQEYFFVSASLQDICRRTSAPYGDVRSLAREGRHPAERYASGHRRRRADAAFGRRPPACAWDEAWQITRRPSPTPTTRCCRKRWKPGRSPCSRRCCRATCRSSTAINAASSDARREGNAGDDALSAACP